MIELRGKRVLVVGLARSGRAVAQRLAREGAAVTVTDLRPPASFGFALKELMAQRIGLELGIHREETFVKQDLIVVSPGVPWDLSPLEEARRRRITAVPEIEAASWFFDGTLVGITGTNGKTTTTTLLGKMLEASGFPVLVAGNIGVPLISAVELFSPEHIVVAELSSFQLEAIQTFRPNVAILLNVTPNHLDRHHTFDAYVAAKAQIFRNQRPDDYAILNADDPVVTGLAPAIGSRKLFFSVEQDLPEGVLLSRGRVLYRVGNLERALFEEKEVGLRGRFNTQNVMAAAAAACALGADFNAIREVAREFSGVEHRLEFVASIGGVAFYNDSKATSVDAAAKALSTFDRGVHLILGGKDKGASYAPLAALIEGRVKFVYLIGSAAGKIASELQGANLVRAGNLETAVRSAFARAVAGDTVLLSPACSSYDQFEDFEHRGKAFKELVHTLSPHRAPMPPSSPEEPVTPAPRAEPVVRPPAAVPPPIAQEETTADRSIEMVQPRSERVGAVAAAEAASSAAVAAAAQAPIYVYETEAEESAPTDWDSAEIAPAEELAAGGALIEETGAVSPYEVSAPDPSPEAGVESGKSAGGKPLDETAEAGRRPVDKQPELFPLKSSIPPVKEER